MNEAEYLMKNYGIKEGVTASTDKTLQDLHNSSYELRKPNSIIVLLFIQNNS